jgi:hypothetical protein
MDRVDAVGVAPSVLPNHGPIARPEGEVATGHAPQGEEDSPEALANQETSVSIPSHTARKGGEGGIDGASPAASTTTAKKRVKVERPTGTIVRATTKYEIRLDALSEAVNRGRKAGQPRQRTLEETEARDALVAVSRMVTTASNVGIRSIVRADTEALDAFQGEHGRMPVTGELTWPSFGACKADSPHYVYRTMCRAVPELSTSITTTLGKKMVTKWGQERFDAIIRQTRSAPHYRLGGPVAIPASVVRWTWDAEHGRALCTVTLFSMQRTTGVRAITIPVVARDDRQRCELEQLAAGHANPEIGWRPGEVILQRDRLHPQKWFMRVSYSRIVTERTGGKAAAINLGMRCMLAFFIEGGESDVYEARDIEAYLKQMQRRRRDRQAGYRWTDGGRRGHGQPRALQSIEVLATKATNYRTTRIQTLARRLASRLAEAGVTTLYVQDFQGIRDSAPEKLATGSEARNVWIWERIQEWPYAEMQSRIVSCCEEMGIRCVTLEARYNSQRCPVCGQIDAEFRDLVRWRLRHRGCGMSRHLDVGHAMNALARGVAMDPGGKREINGLAPWVETGNGTARTPGSKRTRSRGSGETPGKSSESD